VGLSTGDRRAGPGDIASRASLPAVAAAEVTGLVLLEGNLYSYYNQNLQLDFLIFCAHFTRIGV